MPAWGLEGGREAILKRLATPSMRSELQKETARIILEERGGGDPNNVQLARCDWDPSLAGKRLGDVTKGRGLEPTVDNAAATALWIVEKGGCSGIFHAIGEDDLQRILRHPATMIGSDGEIPSSAKEPTRAATAPSRACWPLRAGAEGHLAREAVRKIAAFPAQHRPGRPQRAARGRKPTSRSSTRLRDLATFERPHRMPRRDQVIVNGRSVRRRQDDRGAARRSCRPGRPPQPAAACPALNRVTLGTNADDKVHLSVASGLYS